MGALREITLKARNALEHFSQEAELNSLVGADIKAIIAHLVVISQNIKHLEKAQQIVANTVSSEGVEKFKILYQCNNCKEIIEDNLRLHRCLHYWEQIED